MFFAHLAFFLFCLNNAAFLSEFLQLTIENLVFAEFAFQRTIVYGNLDAWFQTDLFEAFLAITQYPCFIIEELMLEALANHAVSTQQVWRRDAFAIRRIHHDDTLLSRLREIFEVSFLNRNILGKSGSLHIEASRINSFDIYVITINMMLEFAFLRLIIVDAVEHFSIIVRPFFEGISLTEDTRCHITCDERSLNKQCTATTHRINEISFSMPSGHHNHTGSQDLIQWSFYTFLTITSAVQRLATGIQTQCTVIFSDVHIQTDVRIGHADIRAVTRLLAKLIYDSILHFVRYKLGMAEFFREYHRVYRESFVEIQVFGPVNLLDLLVHIVSAVRFKMPDRF